MEFIPAAIPEILLIEPKVYEDPRGFFMETYREAEFNARGIPSRFVQENQTRSTKGVLRGLHYQIKQAQGKLVRVTAGEVFDVAVDIRRASPTFGKWVGMTLSAENRRQMWIPEGFAHGFYVVSDRADFVYKVTDYYAPQWERGILWNDPALGIEWPLDGASAPVLSQKDLEGKLLADAEVFE
ncbi:MAG: dTDP-4-dehydrorhamnose 3,5-epimerase [Chloroflexi bacterium CFX1]|nr:dTDP-4-dehydrorhamnose 3,5-epimerase [Chloroflexi bacterium CFX1]MCQ3954799.1 dTDP-4-dehydrorhamnose 3,5-epimerase [Chloroflexota bacterium]MDL1920457.1 dTDP-4-dehydrorhamnose 3,5-epimerase [Chloroflexi bacterium CFX5]